MLIPFTLLIVLCKVIAMPNVNSIADGAVGAKASKNVIDNFQQISAASNTKTVQINNLLVANNVNRKGKSLEIILSNFNAKTFMTEIKHLPHPLQIESIKRVIKMGHLNELIYQPDFVLGIKRWTGPLMMYAISGTINDGNIKALTTILKTKPAKTIEETNLFKESVVQAAKKGRLDMVVEIARYGDLVTLDEAYKQMMILENNEKYLKLLVDRTRYLKASDLLLIHYAENAAKKGRTDLLQIFLDNLDKVRYSPNQELRRVYSKTYNIEITDELLEFYALRDISEYAKGNEEVLVKSRILKIFEGKEAVEIVKSVQSLDPLSKYALIDAGILNADVNVLLAMIRFNYLSSEFERVILDYVESQRWDYILKLSRYFSLEVGNAIMKISDSSTRTNLFKSFLKTLITFPERDSYLQFYFYKVAATGDVKMMNGLFEIDSILKINSFQKSQEISKYPEISAMIEKHSDPSYWMLVNGLINASKRKNIDQRDEMMSLLISKLGKDVATGDNTLLKLAVITGNQSLLEMLLRNSRIIKAWPSDDWFDDSMKLATKYGHNKVVEVLVRARESKPDTNFAAGAAR